MQIPETPKKVEDLDLMQRLGAYAEGRANWDPGAKELGENARRACRVLHTSVCQLVNDIFARLLDRTTSREMESFTMHDRAHGLKVAHLMWHILSSPQRERLTPPEIGMLVIAAHLHDVGTMLGKEERQARLDPKSDLWDKLEVQEFTRHKVEQLRHQVGDPSLTDTARMRAKLALDQAEEALLCQDTRERHATRQRYEEILCALERFHEQDGAKLPSVVSCLSFDGDSFRNKLVDVCVSHNEDAGTLVRPDAGNPHRPRFARDFPVGCCAADLHMIAAALRLADILDFDRERTPPVVFHYFVPGSLSLPDAGSALEWGKHMAISNWHMDEAAIVFRGRCYNHIIHHAIIQFCAAIQNEIAATRATFGAMQEEVTWPFQLPLSVKADIHEEGYRYVPYRLELDGESIYELLMGGAIYDNPLVAVRELVQNAVDACKLRDALTQLDEPYLPKSNDRIVVCYEEPTDSCPQPTLTLTDTGTGMDSFILERYFLKVGQSYYRSSEFSRERAELHKKNLDFAPVSEFGIGFLSCFLLADRVKVETAMWEPRRGDTRKRTLIIDGPTRLIRLLDEPNEGTRRFKGTRVTLYLTRGGRLDPKRNPPTWEEIKGYLEDVCEDLPYRLNLEHHASGEENLSFVDPKPLTVELPAHLESLAIRIPVESKELGLEGEIALVNPYKAEQAEADLFKTTSASVDHRERDVPNYSFERSSPYSALLRGGFKIGSVSGLPDSFVVRGAGRARLRFNWAGTANRRFPPTNLARNAPSDLKMLAERVTRLWLTHFLEDIGELPEGQFYHLRCIDLQGCAWLEKYDALRLYQLAAKGWHFSLLQKGWKRDELVAWEESAGSSLGLGVFRDSLFWRLLDLILPRIATLQMGPQASFYVKPPIPGWRATLRGWRRFITAPVKWGLFVEYNAGIEDLIRYEYPGSTQFNSYFKERLAGFSESELVGLSAGLDKLIDAAGHEQPAELTRSEANLVGRAQDVVGDLKIGSIRGSWRLDSFRIPEIPDTQR